MRVSLIIVALVFASAATAWAETYIRVFPPQGCQPPSTIILTWDKVNPVKCQSPASLLPNCTNGQVLTKQSGKFLCVAAPPCLAEGTCTTSP